MLVLVVYTWLYQRLFMFPFPLAGKVQCFCRCQLNLADAPCICAGPAAPWLFSKGIIVCLHIDSWCPNSKIEIGLRGWHIGSVLLAPFPYLCLRLIDGGIHFPQPEFIVIGESYVWGIFCQFQ